MTTALARLLRAPLLVLLAVGMGACASSVSVSGFKGEERAVAQKVADLEADTIGHHQEKVCANDLSSALVARLNKAPGGCERVIKDQQAEIDPGLEVTVKSVQLGGSVSARTATASVKSTFSGKRRTSTMLFVKERGKWKISGVR